MARKAVVAGVTAILCLLTALSATVAVQSDRDFQLKRANALLGCTVIVPDTGATRALTRITPAPSGERFWLVTDVDNNDRFAEGDVIFRNCIVD